MRVILEGMGIRITKTQTNYNASKSICLRRNNISVEPLGSTVAWMSFPWHIMWFLRQQSESGHNWIGQMLRMSGLLKRWR